MSDETQALTPGEPSLDELLAQIVTADESGQPVDRQLLLARHPQFAGELREFFANRDQMRRLAGPLRGSAGGNGSVRTKLRYFGDYELLDEIAAGGMGIVYKARQVSLNRIVAVKMILKGTLASEDDVKRFRAEAEAAANLQHPGIVAIHEVGLHEGQHYFSMDFVDGQSLAQLPREQPLAASQAAEYVKGAAEAVHYAHQQGTLHRDLKPSNILIDGQGRVRITDFGLAKRIEGNSDLTLTGQVLGTPAYMPPEQALSKRSLIGTASDVYSLGAVLYELLTGRPPFRGESPAETLRQVESLDPISPRLLSPATPRDLETICLKCLEKEPHKRYATAQHLADDLGRFLRHEPIHARPARGWQLAVKWIRRHPTATGLVAMSLVALLALVGLGVGQSYNDRLERLNVELAGAKANLEQHNQSLQSAKSRLEGANQQLVVASGNLERALDQVTAERLKARQYLYAARLALAQRADQEGDAARVVSLLRSVIPESVEQDDLRDFEWHYLWRKHQGEESRLRGHEGAVTAVAVSPDDRWIATGGADRTIKLWDAKGQPLATLPGHSGAISSLSFSRDGRLLLSSSADKTAKVWNLDTKAAIQTIGGHDGPVAVAAFSPDLLQVATVAAKPDEETIRLWNLQSGQRAAAYRGRMIRGLAMHPTRLEIAAASDGKLLLWNPLAAEPPVAFDSSAYLKSANYYDIRGEILVVGHELSLAFSPDGKRLAAGLTIHQRDVLKGTVTVWDVESKQPVGTHDLACRITQVVFSPDGTLLAASGMDQTVHVWQAESGEHVCNLRAADGIHAVAFTPDSGRVVAGTANGTVMIWSLPARQKRAIFQGKSQINSVAFGGNGRQLAGIAANDAALVWDAMTGRQLSRFPLTGNHHRLALSPVQTWLAGVPPRGLTDVASGQPLAEFPAAWVSREGPYGFAFSQDERLVAVASGGNSVGLWDATAHKPLRTFELRGWASCVAFNHDASLLAAGSGFFSKTDAQRGALQIWNTATGEAVIERQDFAIDIWGVAFSPDGRRLAAAMGQYEDGRASPGRIRIWDTSTWRTTHDLVGHAGCVWAVEFSPSGKRLASASGRPTGGILRTSRLPQGETRIWDVATGEELLTIPGGPGGVLSVAFSPDGRRLATGSQNGQVEILDGSPLLETPRFQALPDGFVVAGKTAQDRTGSRLPLQLEGSQYRAGEGPVSSRPDPDIPVPLSPEPDAVLANGRSDQMKVKVWEFRWQAVAGATSYELVIRPPGRNPVERHFVTKQTTHRISDTRFVAEPDLRNWSWRVFAYRDGVSLPRSEPRTFHVAPIDLDAPVLDEKK